MLNCTLQTIKIWFKFYFRKAMKMMKKEENEEKEESVSSAENEIKVFPLMHHQYILKYFEHFEYQTSENSYICVITEFCEVTSLFLTLSFVVTEYLFLY